MGFRMGRSLRLLFLTSATVVLVHSMCIRPSGMVVYYRSAMVYTICFPFEIGNKMSEPMGFRLGLSFKNVVGIANVGLVLVHSLCIRHSGMAVYYKSETMHTLFQWRD